MLFAHSAAIVIFAATYVVIALGRLPGFRLDRAEGRDRQQTYSVHAYSGERPAGHRYRPAAGAERP